MKFVIALSFLLAVAAAAPAQESKYTTKYDGINLDEILKSDRLFNNYYKCLMDQGRCTPDGKELKCEYFTRLTLTHPEKLTESLF